MAIHAFFPHPGNFPLPETGAPYGPNINKHSLPALRDDSDNLNSIPENEQTAGYSLQEPV